ncbi:hypothetical protein ACDK62_10280 [Streptococcus dysgalactiae]|uniref:hypothetical protein n=1 Tax=Streptococcus dysgalactiae TaxID=1334 RepID=UPI003530A74D
MTKYYVSAKIANLDIGAETEAQNQHMAPIAFKEMYAHLLKFGNHELIILGVEEVN